MGDLFQLLVKLQEVDSNVEDSEGNTPPHLAAAEGHLDCLRLLVYHKHQPMDVVFARNNEVSLIMDFNLLKKSHGKFLINIGIHS